MKNNDIVTRLLLELIFRYCQVCMYRNLVAQLLKIISPFAMKFYNVLVTSSNPIDT